MGQRARSDQAELLFVAQKREEDARRARIATAYRRGVEAAFEAEGYVAAPPETRSVSARSADGALRCGKLSGLGKL